MLAGKRRLLTESAFLSFRARAKEVLGIVSNNTNAMKSTANWSQETKQHSEGVLSDSNEASANVSMVAEPDEESAIAEINLQLTLTPD